MAKEPVTKIIKDDEGTDHVYIFTPVGSSKGVKMMRTLMHIAGGSIGQLIDSIKSAVQGDEAALDADLDGQLIGSALRELAKSIFEHGDEKLFRDLLVFVTRDDGRVEVQATFDHVYQANYGELGVAIFSVLEVNYGPLLRRLFGGEVDLSGLKDKLTTKASSLFSSRPTSIG